MATYNYKRKKPDTVFLNVKPAMQSNGQDYVGNIRKYSIGLAEHLNGAYLNADTKRHNRISISTVGSMNHTFSSSVFYRCMAPINWFLCGLGALPLVRSGPGRTKFIAKSITFIYALIFYAVLLIYALYVANIRIQIVRSLNGPFEEAVIAYLFLVHILPIITIPILWLETEKVARLFNDWDEFEVLYYQISGHSLPLVLKLKSATIAISLPMMSVVSVIITHITMDDLILNQIVPYCILDNLTAMLGAWWFLIYESLSNTAHILAERFQKALRHIGPAAMIADYRALWLRLSKLTRDTGNATCYTFVFICLYLFFIITLSIYGLMSQLSEGFGIKDIGLTITALWNVCLLFYMCDEAHYAAFNVRINFQKKLLMAELSWMNSDAQTEINMFLRATEMSPSNINCGGFFDINRNLFKGLLTTMVTYLVVLLQFQISIPIEGNRSGVTTGDGENTTMTDIADLLSDIVMHSLNNDASLLHTTTTATTMLSQNTAKRGRKG